MSAERICVLVTGAGGTTGQSIIKSLRMSTLPCRIVATDIRPDSPGLYRADAAYLLPHSKEPDYASDIITILNKESVNLLLIGSTPEVPVLANLAERIEMETQARVVVSHPDLVKRLSDKLLTCQTLELLGPFHPKYARDISIDALIAFVNQVGFPLVVKPRRGTASQGVKVVHALDELQTAIELVEFPVVQEFLGPDDQEYTSGLFFDANGAYKGCIVLKRSMKAGETYRAEVGDFPEIKEAINKVGTFLAGQARGGLNVQLRKTNQGVKIFEINPRFSSSTAIMSHFGFNAPEAAVRSFVLGEEIPYLGYRTGFAFRYTNEIYVSESEFSRLRETGHLDSPKSTYESHF